MDYFYHLEMNFMDNVKIQTTQNVDIEYQIASVGDRIIASLIDYGFFIAYFLICFSVLNLIYIDSGIVKSLIYLPVLFYDLIFETFFQGKSLGKMIMKIKVVKLDGSQAAFSDYLLRWVLRIVDTSLSMGLVAFITVIVNGKGQRLGDIAAGTSVIRIKQKTNLSDTILSDINFDYHVTFQEVARLTDNDVAIIKEVLAFGMKYKRPEAFIQLAKKTKEVMGVTTTLSDTDFLEMVLMDYNHYHINK